MEPTAPYLVIREGKAFWVNARPVSETSATLQAFDEGCFREASVYDVTGRLWPIASASLKSRPSLWQRLLPWRRVPVALRLGPPTSVSIPEVVSWLTRVISGGEFLGESARANALRRLEAAKTPTEILEIARDCAE